MAHDAIEQSLNGTGQSRSQPFAGQAPREEPPLEAQVRDLQDILSYILNQVENATARMDEHIAVGLPRVEENAARIDGLAAKLDAIGCAEEIMRRAVQGGAPPAPPHPHAKPKRDRRGFTLIRGGMAALVPLGAGLRWLARSRAHKAIAWGAGLTLATATAIGSPAIATLPGAPHPRAAVVTHRHHRHRQPSVLPAMPPGAGAAPRYVGKRHPAADDDDVAVRPSPSPDASPTAASSPTVSPSPVTSPTVSPSPG